MPYTITNYTYKQAKKIGVVVKPSTNKTKKIDVYKKGKKVASIGAYGMSDFPTYMKTRGKKYAKTRRRLYKRFKWLLCGCPFVVKNIFSNTYKKLKFFYKKEIVLINIYNGPIRI